MALKGSVSTGSYQGRYVKLTWTATQNIADNSSTISWTLKGAGEGQASWYKAGPFRVTIDNVVVWESSSRIKLYNGTTVKTSSKKIPHNNEGKKSVKIKVEAAIYNGDYNKSGSDTFALDTIPRKATITSAPNFNDTENPKIEYSNLAENSITSLKVGIYKTDGKTAIIGYEDIPKVNKKYPKNGSYTFNFTNTQREALQSNCNTANSMNVRFYLCTTIGGKDYYHYITKKLTIKDPKPTLNPKVTADAKTIAITGDNLIWLKGETNLTYEFKAVAQKKSTITNYEVKCGTKSGEAANGTLTAVDGEEVKFVVKDSRKNDNNSVIKCKSLIEYFKPKISSNLEVNLSMNKTSEEGGENSSGNIFKDESTATFIFTLTGKYYYNDSVKLKGETNKIQKIQYKYAKADEFNSKTDWIPFNNYVTSNGNIGETKIEITTKDYTSPYTFQARVSDNLGEFVYTSPITLNAQSIFEWGKDDFTFNVPIRTDKYNYATSHHELAGSSYADSSLDRYVPSGGGLYLPNSDINGVNGLFFNYDVVNNLGEGIFFPLFPSSDEYQSVAHIDLTTKKHATNGTKYQRYGQLYINRSGNLRMVLGVVPGVLSLSDMHQATSPTNWWKPTSEGKYQYLVINITGEISTDNSPFGEKGLLYK